MNRSDLQRLAQERLDDANALFQSGRYSGAYYLAGYAVECGLKACIASQIRQYEYPPTANFSRELFTHDLNRLVTLAQLKPVLESQEQSSPPFALNWAEVERWTEQSRYEFRTQQEAQRLIDAVSQVPDGVLEWIRQHW